MTRPIVNGLAVARCCVVPWEATDDEQLTTLAAAPSNAWRVVSRARVEWPEGGLANGLVLEDNFGARAVVIWERPREGGAGHFRLVPLGDWISPSSL